MADVPAKLVMAMRRVTDLPVRDCREVLREAECDIGRAFDMMSARLWFGRPRASDLAGLRAEFVASVNAELDHVPGGDQQ